MDNKNMTGISLLPMISDDKTNTTWYKFLTIGHTVRTRQEAMDNKPKDPED
jgi:hypothetical protein